ncbi:hypothetical protein PIB30_086445 [Stylosanthes scabra]|uniref:Zinc finger GRF-type domain-containing protein n=1 Tax=Stylosanthes scabra TaxID=79078 RepID=A0ABU6UVP9_9FABA|nr:hypothetical protein [Stylosanthes scabra]
MTVMKPADLSVNAADLTDESRNGHMGAKHCRSVVTPLLHDYCEIRVSFPQIIRRIKEKPTMESEGVSSGSRRSAGSGRSERSSSTQGVFTAKVGDDRVGAALKCMCGVYAIQNLSRTAKNLNKLFFGCPFFKADLPHYKFFVWLNRHTAKLIKIGTREFEEEKGRCE